MGHTVQAFIAKIEILQEASGGLNCAHVVSLEQGLALLLNTDEFYDELSESEGDNLPHEEFHKLSSELTQFGVECSAHTAIAYIETDYWGGEGEQAALLWEHGQVVYGPSKGRMGPINDVLRRMGVERRNNLDEFEAVGLHRYRDNKDWIEQPHYGASA
jgi:hypothetical protein